MGNIVKSVLIGVAMLMTSCVVKEKTASGFLPGKKLSELKDKKLREVSGLASSYVNPGLFWAHNDSGNGAEVFLIDDHCEIQQSVVLEGIDNRDWEDITVGPGPDSSKSYVYVGDIGDNNGSHTLKYIYRFEEPIYNADDSKQTLNKFDTIIFRLPNSRRMDSEALFIDWKTKDLYIITKREQPVYVYQLKYPYSTKDTVDTQEVAVLPTTQIVAADLSPDGNELIIKNYSHVYYWNNTAGKSLAELLTERPEELPYVTEPQGESLTWARDGSGFYTISEVNKGEPSYLIFYGRK